MKRNHILFTVLAAVALAGMPLTAAAQETYLVDSADLVSHPEAVEDALAEVNAGHGIYAAVKTTDSLEGMRPSTYADQWYEANATDEDGIVLVVGMDTREYFILTSGSCIYAFTDAGLDFIEAQIVLDMSAGDYETAFLEFAGFCDDYLVQAEKGKPYDGDHMPKKPYNLGLSLLIALAVGAAAGGIGIAVLFANLKSVHQQRGAADYTKPNSFHLDVSRDLYLYKKVRRVEKSDNDDNKRSGSSTFTGSSGDSRGGSGGSF